MSVLTPETGFDPSGKIKAPALASGRLSPKLAELVQESFQAHTDKLHHMNMVGLKVASGFCVFASGIIRPPRPRPPWDGPWERLEERELLESPRPEPDKPLGLPWPWPPIVTRWLGTRSTEAVVPAGSTILFAFVDATPGVSVYRPLPPQIARTYLSLWLSPSGDYIQFPASGGWSGIFPCIPNWGLMSFIKVTEDTEVLFTASSNTFPRGGVTGGAFGVFLFYV